jgi:RNA polymerase sigma factor (sigma-70 family)
MSSTATTGTFGRLALRCQPDARLVALTREGADPAFEEVVRRYRGRLVAYASGIVRPDRAEDVVQDSLVRALTAVRDSDSEINLRPWLHTIVRNRALNDLRDEPALEHLDENFDGVPQPPDVAARKEELAGVVDQVKALPDAQREALVQREFEGRSHEEIAAAMDVTPGAVRGLIFRARSSLRNVAGLAIPMPVLRALVESSAAAGGGAATVAAAGGGGGLVKIGAAIGVAALAIGSGVAIHDHDGSGGNEATADSNPPIHRTHHSTQQASSGLSSGAATSNASSTSASDNGGGQSRSTDTSGSGHGSSGSGSGGNSGPSPAGGSSGPSPASGSGSSGGGDDHSGSGGGGGSSGSGEPGDGGGGTTTTTGDGGGDHSGPGGGGDGGGTTTTTGDGGGDHSGPGGGGDDGGTVPPPPTGGGDGSGDGGDGGGTTTTTTTTTTPQPPHGD